MAEAPRLMKDGLDKDAVMRLRSALSAADPDFDGEPVQNNWKTQKQVPATSAISDALSKDLKKRGFKFVG